MSPEIAPQKRKQGFASLTPERLKEVSAKGGRKTGVPKGFGAVSPEQRKENSSKAAKVRWSKVKEVQQDGSPSIQV